MTGMVESEAALRVRMGAMRLIWANCLANPPSCAHIGATSRPDAVDGLLFLLSR